MRHTLLHLLDVDGALSRMIRLFLLGILVTLGACATGNSHQSTPVKPTISVPTPTPQSSTEQQPKTLNASVELRNQAVEAIDSGEYSQAKRLLERALRVDSRDPDTWYEYARLNQLQQNVARARQMINKALGLKPSSSTEKKLRELETQLDNGAPSLQS